MTIKGVFFDLLCTLFNYGDMTAELSDWLAEFNVSLKKHGLLMSLESFKEYYNNRRSRESTRETTN